ncbi:MAG TPA: zinc-binding dehydrogenase [Thermoleophilaceae bacterium]|nr:zinc-binding dehydrogenase [Thermoleophilaceae bacterium]
MRSVVITKAGPPEVLQVQERPDPRPGPGQVRVEVGAAGVNFADLMARVGLYPDAPDLPAVVGYEVAGIVAELGEGVDRYTVGERVMAGTRFGGYSEQVVANVTDTAPLPESLSFEEGAAVPVNYLTAYLGLRRFGALEPGERVFLHAAAGGVGIAATQIAKHRGAEVWGSASPGKHDAIRGFGVDHAVDYTRSGWEKGLPPMDVVMDALGGKSFRRSYDMLRAGGRLIAFGAAGVVEGDKRNLIAAGRTALTMPRFNLIKQMSASKSVIGLNMLTIWDELGSLEPFMAAIEDLLDQGVLEPVVAASFPFDRAGEAHRYIGERRNIGKVVLTP